MIQRDRLFQHQAMGRFLLLCSGLVLATGILLSIADNSFLSLWLRVLVGLIVFVLPGGYLFVLIPVRASWDIIDFVGYGFSFSIALITLLGLITRTLAWSIDTVEFVWYGLAVMGFAAAMYKLRSGGGGFHLNVSPQQYVLLAVIFFQVLLFAHSSVIKGSSSDDQSLHQAEINSFLRDDPLGWSEPFQETGNRIADRVYLTYWILAQALVVEISSVPILLAHYLVNPFVLIMSVAAIYIFARNLGNCRKTSLMVVILGLLGLSLVAEAGKMPGSQFFVHAKMDKNLAAFALAPIAISSAWLYSQSAHWRTLWALALSYLACAFVHPIIGGFVASIIGIWCLFRLVTKRGERKNAIQIGLLILLLFSPSLVMRLTTTEPWLTNSGVALADVELFDFEWILDGILRKSGVLTFLLIALTSIAVVTRWSDPKSKLLMAFVLVIGFGMLPIGGWLYGFLVAHASRVYWLTPIGYMFFFVIQSAGQRFPRFRVPRVWFFFLALPVTAFFLQFHSRADFSRDIGTVTNRVAEFLEIAEYIDANHDARILIAASPEPEYRNRAITLGWKVISLSHFSAGSMSYYSNMSYEEAAMQRNDNFRLYSADVPVAEKLAIIDRYGIDYLLFPKGYAWMIDALYQTDKQRFELVYSGEVLRLVKVREKSS